MGNRDDQDTIWCLDSGTGKVIWNYSYPCPLDPRYYEGGPSATPTIYQGSVFPLSKKGHAFRFDLDTGKVIWSRNLVVEEGFELPEWSFASSPFIEGDRVLLNVGRQGLALSKETGNTGTVSAHPPAGDHDREMLDDAGAGERADLLPQCRRDFGVPGGAPVMTAMWCVRHSSFVRSTPVCQRLAASTLKGNKRSTSPWAVTP